MLAQGPPPEGAADASIEIKSSICGSLRRSAILVMRSEVMPPRPWRFGLTGCAAQPFLIVGLSTRPKEEDTSVPHSVA